MEEVTDEEDMEEADTEEEIIAVIIQAMADIIILITDIITDTEEIITAVIITMHNKK